MFLRNSLLRPRLSAWVRRNDKKNYRLRELGALSFSNRETVTCSYRWLQTGSSMVFHLFLKIFFVKRFKADNYLFFQFPLILEPDSITVMPTLNFLGNTSLDKHVHWTGTFWNKSCVSHVPIAEALLCRIRLQTKGKWLRSRHLIEIRQQFCCRFIWASDKRMNLAWVAWPSEHPCQVSSRHPSSLDAPKAKRGGLH